MCEHDFTSLLISAPGLASRVFLYVRIALKTIHAESMRVHHDALMQPILRELAVLRDGFAASHCIAARVYIDADWQAGAVVDT
jgi:hypothetical protein